MPHSTVNATITCTVPCNLCESDDIEVVRSKDRHGKPLQSVICRRCGLVWSDPRPSPDELRRFYESEYRVDYKGSFQPKPKHAYRAGKVALDRCRRLKPLLADSARVLDVGAGSGEVVYMLRALEYDASGFEPNEGYARYAAEQLGLPVSQGFWQDADIQPESQDMVTMFHVVEHLEDPLEVMQHARQWLKPNGLLLVEVPNVEAVCQQPHSQFHTGHLYHFGLATMEAMHRKAGYEVVDRGTSSDGGNIAVVSRKVESSSINTVEMPENYKRVASIIARHTAIRHALSPHPYTRPIRKLTARLDEKRGLAVNSEPKAMLDQLIRQL